MAEVCSSDDTAFFLKTDTDVVTLTFDLLTPKSMDFQDSWWNICVSSMVILAASVFDIHLEKKTDSHENPIYANAITVTVWLINTVAFGRQI